MPRGAVKIRPDEHLRPDPDALLRQAAREARGRLKLFLGAAPGVGKTYEMLTEGAAWMRGGADVVVGVVETHGRAETEALTRPFEIVPRRSIEHLGRPLAEMDLDAILARKPRLVLVDELAHSNAPGSRHPKRWQDVQELIDAGIDVYSTVNIQHLESLNDVVASFTKVRVRETVPDHVLEQAEIEIVDIPPDELIDRLRDGKVYVPEEASRALGHFFSKSNLSALRELALRRAAQAVDSQMLDHLRAHALGGSFASGERIVVAVDETAAAAQLVRAAKRLADALRAPWTVLHVETHRSAALSQSERQMLADALALAVQLGATTASIPARGVAQGILAQVRDMRATQIVLGKSQRSWWFKQRHGSVVDRIIAEVGDVAVHVLPGDGRAPSPVKRAWRPGEWGAERDYFWSALMVAVMTGIGVTIASIIDLSNVAMLFLLPVLVAASRFGLWPGLFTGLSGALAYNFFLLPPHYSLTIGNPENVVSFVVLLATAVIVSKLAANVRVQADLAARSARQNAALAGFAQAIAAAGNRDELAQLIAAEIGRLFAADTVMLFPAPDGARIAAAIPPNEMLGQIEQAAANWSLDRVQPAGLGSDTLTGSDWAFEPIRKGDVALATIGLAGHEGRPPVRRDEYPLLASLLDQAALAIDRMALSDDLRDIEDVRRRDRLRSALLSSVSHDLRTPLTAIQTAVGELRGSAPSPLVDTIGIEAQRLNRFVTNLLDMARVQAGGLNLTIEAVDLTDAVASAVHDARHALTGHAILLDVSPDLPMVRADPALLHHTLLNLIDNAGRYADPGTPIAIVATRAPDRLTLSVRDQGPGIPAGREAALFESFARFDGSDRARSGTGLGLAIVKGFAEAMGMGVTAANREDGTGASFSLIWPDAAIVRANRGEPK